MEIVAKIGSPAVSNYVQIGSTTISDMISFYHTGKVFYLRKIA